jgi:hypothetical protein
LTGLNLRLVRSDISNDCFWLIPAVFLDEVEVKTIGDRV